MQIAWGQGIQFEGGTLEAAQDRAAREKKMLMVIVCSDSFETCRILREEIFTQPAVGAAFNSHFVVWSLEFNAATDPYIAGVRLRSMPEFIFWDAMGRPQYRAAKYKDAEEMVALAALALDPKNHLDQLRARYKAGERAPTFVRNYILEMEAIGEDMQLASRDYLRQIGQQAWLLPENWRILSLGTTAITEPTFRFVLDHLATFQQQQGEVPVNDFLLGVYRNSLTEAATRQNPQLLGECHAIVRRLLPAAEAAPIVLQDQLTYYRFGGNWNLYYQRAVSLLTDYPSDNPQLYNDVAWNLYCHVHDPQMLQQAREWAQRSVDLGPAYWNCHTLASLDLRLGDAAAADAHAHQALYWAAPASEEADTVQALLQRIEKYR